MSEVTQADLEAMEQRLNYTILGYVAKTVVAELAMGILIARLLKDAPNKHAELSAYMDAVRGTVEEKYPRSSAHPVFVDGADRALQNLEEMLRVLVPEFRRSEPVN